jgi:hypothetical protein
MSSLRNAFQRVLMIGALACLGFVGSATLVPSDASASVSIAVPFDALVKDADQVAVITAAESKSVWEDGRIFTYTKVKIDQGVAGDLGAGADGWVRTMGGVVGKIGQMVDGEPVFTTGKTSLVFMRKFKGNEVFEVSARAQGQYPVLVDEKSKTRKVMRSSNVGMLLPPKDKVQQANASQVQTQSVPAGGQSATSQGYPTVVGARLAQDVMHDKALDDVVREVATTWKKLHPPTTK